jgi:hypothetical protein
VGNFNNEARRALTLLQSRKRRTARAAVLHLLLLSRAARRGSKRTYLRSER